MDRYAEFIASCCYALEVDVEDVLAHCKAVRPVVQARQFIAWALRERWGLSYPHLARLLNRDHSTIIVSVRKVARALVAREPWAVQSLAACQIKPRVEMPIESALESLTSMVGAAE